MKKFFLTFGRTAQFGLAGFMGMVISAQRFLTYSPDNDRSHGISLWILAGAFLLSTAYFILFCILRFLVVKSPVVSESPMAPNEETRK